MPAKRLPWYKVWAEHTDHEKICSLTDGEYRTWHYLLATAAQQPTRWRFASTKHAATVTSRPERQIKRLVSATLLDLREDGSLWIHDWQNWQRWVAGEEHTNDSPTTHERPSEEHTKNTRTTHEAPSRPLERGERTPTSYVQTGDKDTPYGPPTGDEGVCFGDAFDVGYEAQPRPLREPDGPKTDREAAIVAFMDRFRQINRNLGDEVAAKNLYRQRVAPGDDARCLAALEAYYANELRARPDLIPMKAAKFLGEWQQHEPKASAAPKVPREITLPNGEKVMATV